MSFLRPAWCPAGKRQAVSGVFQENGTVTPLATELHARFDLRPAVALARYEVAYPQGLMLDAEDLAANVATEIAFYVRNNA
jgi:hypothetical protein